MKNHKTPSNGQEDVIIGIDLGTTNSCVAVINRATKTVEVIADTDGNRTTPSVLSYRKGNCLVGADAKLLADSDPTHTLYSTKRFIGRKYQEIATEAQIVPYKITQNTTGNAVFEIDGKQISPEEAAAKILTKMKKIAEAHLGKKVTDAVITVPAYFNASQRQSTRDAGIIAGLNVRNILTEPTAAALAYGLDQSETTKTIAVYDLGGGTFDVSILTLSDGIFEVLSTNGDTHLGGDDFDHAILQWMLAEFKTKEGVDLSKDPVALHRLHDATIKAKIALTHAETTEINLPGIAANGSKHLRLSLSRTKLEKLCQNLIERTIAPCRKAMEDAHLKKVDEVILVGGMTRMPAIQKIAKEIFQKTPNTTVDPDEAVAVGAAIKGGIYTGDVDDLLLYDVNPLTLGIETDGGISTPLIERNSVCPIKKTMIFSTAADNQTSVTIVVLQGERTMARDNKEIGRFELTGIPPAPRGKPQIEVTFELNENGILKISAVDQATNKEQKITLQAKSGLSGEEINQKIEEAKRFEENDKRLRESAAERMVAEALTSEKVPKAISEFKGKLSAPLIHDLETSSAALKQALKGNDHEIIKTKTAELQAHISRIYDELLSSSSPNTKHQK